MRPSEKAFPIGLHYLMIRYYQTIFSSAKNKKGDVSDVVGDAMSASWLNPKSELAIHGMACETALKIRLASFNLTWKMKPHQCQPKLDYKVGLHCGEIVMGIIGTKGRYEY